MIEAVIALIAKDLATPAAISAGDSLKELVTSSDAAGQSLATVFKPFTEASKSYSKSVADVTQGTQGFATTLGHVGVAFDTLQKGGIEGAIAGVDLLKMGWSGASAVLAGVSAVVEKTTREFVNNAEAASRGAASSGTTIDQYSKLTDATRMLGKESSFFSETFNQINERMRGALTTTGELQGTMGTLGVSITDSNGRIKTSTELLIDYADVFAAMPDGPEKSAKAIAAFGESGTKILPILNQGSSAIRAQGLMAEGLGSSYTKMDSEMAGAFNRAEGRFDTLAKASTNAIGRVLTPLATKAIEVVNDLATDALVSLSNSADGALVRMAQLQTSLDLAAYGRLSSEIESTVFQIGQLDDAIVANNATLDENREAAARNQAAVEAWALESGESLEFYENSMAGVVASQEALDAQAQSSKNKMLDNLQVLKKELEAKRERILATGVETQQAREALAANDKLLANITDTIKARGDGDRAYQQHLQNMERENAVSREQLEQRNLERRATEIQKQLNTEIFEEKAKLMAAEKTAAEDMKLAIIRADTAVIEAQKKYAQDRATATQQIKLAVIAAEQAVFDEQLKLDVMRRTGAEELARARIAAEAAVVGAIQTYNANLATFDQQVTVQRIAAAKAVVDERIKLTAQIASAEDNLAKGVIAAQASVVSAEQAFAVDRATITEQSKQNRINAERAVFTAETQFNQARETRELEVSRRIIDARRAVFDAETALMVQARTQQQQIAQEAISLQSSILKASTDRVAMVQNRSLAAQKAVIDAELDTDNMRQQSYLRSLTRTERIRQAELGRLDELADREDRIAELKAQLENRALLRLEAKKDVEIEILEQKVEEVRQTALVEERVNAGVAATVNLSMAAGACATGFGAAASAAGQMATSISAAAAAAAGVSVPGSSPFGTGSAVDFNGGIQGSGIQIGDTWLEKPEFLNLNRTNSPAGPLQSAMGAQSFNAQNQARAYQEAIDNALANERAAAFAESFARQQQALSQQRAGYDAAVFANSPGSAMTYYGMGSQDPYGRFPGDPKWGSEPAAAPAPAVVGGGVQTVNLSQSSVTNIVRGLQQAPPQVNLDGEKLTTNLARGLENAAAAGRLKLDPKAIQPRN